GSRARHSHSRAFSHLPPRQIVSRLTPERAYGAQGVVAARSLDAHATRMRIQDYRTRCTVVFTPALRTRMGYAACSMSQGLLLSPTRPVRANCRPDMHLGRPPSHRRHTPAAVWGHAVPETTGA